MDAAPEVPHPRWTWRDAATREGRRCLRVRPHHATWLFCFFSRLVPTRIRRGSIRAESAETAEIQKKKKKKAQNTPFEPNIKPY